MTIFIIAAILIVALIVGYFAFRDIITRGAIPANMEPIYTSFLSCVEENLLAGIDVLESQGGYIELPEFESGSRYMPFSSQLDFIGNPIPYWYYVSGNNIPREQVPSKDYMESQLADFVKSRISRCRFDSYYEQGFEITFDEPNADVSITGGKVAIDLNMDLSIERGEEKALVRSHKVEVNSNLQELYDTAIDIYDREQRDFFLENYGIDVLRLYAPVDGVEITCAPKIWSADKVFSDLRQAIEANTQAIKIKSGDYTLTEEKNKYFVLDLESDADVRFINLQNWTSGFDVSPAEDNVLVAEPVGNQNGLGILGFCYVPYHFVYNVKYPVLTQIMMGEEIFQFPMAVVIMGNKPREALDVEAIGVENSRICSTKNTLVDVKTFNTELESIPAQISYECLSTKCDIGESPLKENFPQCANGYIVAKAEGYRDTRYLLSTINEGSANIIMNKLYEKEIQLYVDSKEYDGEAVVTFLTEGSAKTILYPSQKSIEIAEGQYNVQVYIYRNSTIELASVTKQQCVDVAQEGIAGVLGLTTEKCFDVTIPSQIVSNALYGGGSEDYYVLESELLNTNKIEINSESISTPRTIEELQENYILFEEKGLDINFN